MSVSFTEMWDKAEQAAKEMELGQVPPGEYTFEVVAAKMKTGKEFPYLQVVLKIQDGAYAGKKIGGGTISMSPNALGGSLGKLAQFGLTKDFFKQAGADTMEAVWGIASKALVGRVAKAPIEAQADGQYAGRNQLPFKGIVLSAAPDASGAATPAVAAPPPPPPPPPAPVAPAPTETAAAPNVAVDAEPGF